ncbi:MAG: hypothetical protein IRY99_05230 [Isosphaeraceae bacterium]|nr:hypothetical protein [Isosphaeraceae bacterium]
MRRSVQVGLALALGLGLISSPMGRDALAGPAHYDKDTKSFRFTYTFALLPGGGGDPQLGEVQRPTPDQEEVVKRLLGQVSDLLNTITGGRARINRLDYTDNIKEADLVVSLTGAPASPGYANLSSIEGRPGQIVLYYQSLEPKITQDVVFTVVHELCHYIFGLTDEYRPDNFPRGCPVRTGPGCLMDNYYAAGGRGFMGRFCNRNDHDSEPAQPLSCQDIVDRFFSDLGVGTGGPSGVDQTGTVAPAVDPQKLVIASAIGKVRAHRLALLDQGRGSTALQSFARAMLRDLIDQYNRGNADKLILTGSQFARVLDQIVKAGQVVPTDKPADLEAQAFAKVREEARRLGELFRDVKSESARIARIRTGLRSFLRELITAGQIDAKAFGPSEQAALADRLAREAAYGPSARTLDRLTGLGEVTTELDLAIAEDIVTILDQLEVPGTPTRLDYLTRIRSRLTKDFSIPGRTFSRFGTRRTRIITPDATDENAYVLTQAGVFPYATLRDRSVVQFSRLINSSGMSDRAGKIELASPVTRAGGLGFQPLAPRIVRPFNDIPPEDPSEQRRAGIDVQGVIADTLDQLQRNRLENISLLVPPGGLGLDLGAQVPVIRSRLRSDIDVRLDLVAVGPAPIDTEVRDLVTESRGSVLTVTDIDEIGAIAQRLKNEQTSGNWVIIPLPGTFAPEAHEPLRVKDQLAKVLKPADADSTITTLRQATQKLQEALKPGGLAESTRAQLVEALDAAHVLSESLSPENPNSLRSIAEEIDKQVGEDGSVPANVKADWKRRPDGVNARLLATLGPAKERLAQARHLIARAKRARPLDPTIQKIVEDLEKEDHLGPELKNLADLLRAYEHLLEATLIQSEDYVPIYARIDRKELDRARRNLQNIRKQQALGLGSVPDLDVGKQSIPLARFYAEGNAEFEMILGLSQELPSRPGIAPEQRFRLKLVSDLGMEVADTAKLRFDANTSTPSLLVFRAAAPPLRPGWYTPVLTFVKDDDYKFLTDNEVNFTFSVASDRPNIQLITGLVQPPGSRSKGTVKRAEEYAVIEVQVSAPSSVVDARIEGYYQMITAGNERIETRAIGFRDDGTDVNGNERGAKEFDEARKDRAAQDGIYTAFIPLADVTKATEFRVFVQADTTEGRSHYIALDDPSSGDADEDTTPQRPRDQKARLRQEEHTKAAEGKVLQFQRATSIHFHAEP